MALSEPTNIILLNDTRSDMHFGCQAVMEGLIDFLDRTGCHISSFQPVKRSWNSDPTFPVRAKEASALIVNGEGSMHRSRERAIALAQIGPYSRSLSRVPAILLNATLEYNDERVYEPLKDFALVAVRDTKSSDEVKKFGLPEPLYCPDFSLYHDFSSMRAEPAPSTPRQIGVTDSVVKQVSERLIDLKAQRNLQLCDIHIDPQAGPQTIYDYAARMSELDLLVTGRYHAVCYAINTRTPFVAVESNTSKISSLLKDVFGHNRRVIPASNLNSMDLSAFGGWTSSEMEALERFSASRRASFDALSRAVAACIGRG